MTIAATKHTKHRTKLARKPWGASTSTSRSSSLLQARKAWPGTRVCTCYAYGQSHAFYLINSQDKETNFKPSVFNGRQFVSNIFRKRSLNRPFDLTRRGHNEKPITLKGGSRGDEWLHKLLVCVGGELEVNFVIMDSACCGDR